MRRETSERADRLCVAFSKDRWVAVEPAHLYMHNLGVRTAIEMDDGHGATLLELAASRAAKRFRGSLLKR
jgi:hypothetical protein